MLYVMLIAAVVIFWLVILDRPTLKMEFKDGELVNHKGNLQRGFTQNCKEIAHKTPFTGTVKVYKTRTATKITFSKNVPSKVQQRIRNVFPHQGLKSHGKKQA